MKYSIVCSYMTHDHPETMQEVLDRALKPYADHGIDICIYDDSTTDSTKNLVQSYLEKGATNLYYIDAHSAPNGTQKFLMLLQGYGLPKEYDYIWPSKDRVCFDSEYLDRLTAILDNGPDVVLGMNEMQRWKIPATPCKDVYTDSIEFYRRYAASTINWEATIRKRNTMLLPIDWDLYRVKHPIHEKSPFDQSITLFSRLAEMDHYQIVICQYLSENRFISSLSSSGWTTIGKPIFELWIDDWLKANLSLPDLYAPYIPEVLKSQTNTVEVFGSVYRMIEYNSSGSFDGEIFDRYYDLWPEITEIPTDTLKMISGGNYAEAFSATVQDLENAIANHDHARAAWIILANTWLSEIYGENTYKIYDRVYSQYKYDMITYGHSSVLDGIHRIEDITVKYY